MNNVNKHNNHVPQGWVFERLGNFANYKKGKKPETLSQDSSYKHKFPYVDIKAFEKGVIVNYTDGENCVMCSENDFLMVWDGSRSGYVGKGIKGVLGSTLMKINFPALCNDFAFYFLQSKYLEINSRAKGTGTPHVDPDLLWKYLLPIPPLAEQHRIVEKIEELFSDLDKGIESLKTTQQQLKIYQQAVLKWAFEGKLTAKWREEKKQQGELKSADELLEQIKAEREKRDRQQLQEWNEAVKTWEANGKQGKKPGKPKKAKELLSLSENEIAKLPKLPQEWKWIFPEDIVSPESHSLGIGPFGSNLKVSDYTKSGLPLIFVRHITSSDFDLDAKYISLKKFEELLPHAVKPLDLLVTKMGDPPGDCEIYPVNRKNGVLTADCLKFRVWDEFINRKFYKYCINAMLIKKQLGLITKGVAQKKISLERFKSLKFPLASIEEQHQIVQEIEFRLSICDRLEATITENLQRAEALRQSILKQAFAGKLVPQDPNDEPAEKLLERIRQEKLHINIARIDRLEDSSNAV